MLTTEKKRLIQESLRCLAASHAATVNQIEQTMAVLARALELDVPGTKAGENGGPANRPTADATTFCVTWQGKTCFLGNTLIFWLFERLARSLNHYVAHVDLLDDVWRGEREGSTIRGVRYWMRTCEYTPATCWAKRLAMNEEPLSVTRKGVFFSGPQSRSASVRARPNAWIASAAQ